MLLVDTHAHINFPDYQEDRDQVMQNAFAAGVGKILHSCCSLTEIDQLNSYSQQYTGADAKSDLYFACGVHPTEYEQWTKDSKKILDQKVQFITQNKKHKLRAIGETGLDYYHCSEDKEKAAQQIAFREHIQIAQKYQLPIIVHTRDAWDDTLKIIQEMYVEGSENSGTIHCFTGDLEFANACIARGFYISFSGIVTFKNSKALQAVAKELPIFNILIETDCPFLAPQVKRGKRNEPAYVKYVAEFIAELKEIDVLELADITSQNAQKLFNF